VFDLDAYLDRIGLAGRPTLAEMHRAHATSIPFENLDPRRGVPVSLALEDLQQKLVAERRGGYCFEQNLLFKGALEAVGARVEPLLARVRVGAEPGVTRPRSHLLLRVELDGGCWHADVGFGMGTPLEPLPFGPGSEHEQSGWRFRVAADGEELVLQAGDGALERPVRVPARACPDGRRRDEQLVHLHASALAVRRRTQRRHPGRRRDSGVAQRLERPDAGREQTDRG
jgi:N-hydroxyarylamine O-acetyltransferase